MVLGSLVTMVTYLCHQINWAKIEQLAESLMNCDKDSTVEKGVNREQRRDIISSLKETEEGMPTLQHKRRYWMGTSSRHGQQGPKMYTDISAKTFKPSTSGSQR